MNSDPQSTSSSRAAGHDSQYHHFIPRLILRGFAQDPPNNNPDLSAKARKNGVLHFVRTRDGRLDQSLLSKCYGLRDMYREADGRGDPFEIEKKLSKLESDAGRVIARARTAFTAPGASLVLSRGEKDTLRKFLFIMKYRNSVFHSRFNVATIDEYCADDKAKMRRYMREHGFESPRQVWLANIRAFLDIPIDPEWKWTGQVLRCAYPDDAKLFTLHMEQSYMAFCRPQCADDEFFLTDNVFGIFEGPNSLQLNPGTGELERGVWTEWHNFAPLSASLFILLRSNFLPGPTDQGSARRNEVYRMLLDMHPLPDQAASVLQDLPVERCANSYSTLRTGNVIVREGYSGPSTRDQYTFRCFDLETRHVDLLNCIFLEEAQTAGSVTFKSEGAMRRAIQMYLQTDRPGFKLVSDVDAGRYRYLQALQSALHALGGRADIRCSAVTPPDELRHPLDYATHMARWVAFSVATEMTERHAQLMECHRMLDGSSERRTQGRSGWLEDVEQAGKIAFLHIKIDAALNVLGVEGNAKRGVKCMRQIFFASLRPRSIWLYMKVLRNLEKFDPDDFMKPRMALGCEGREDAIVRASAPLNIARLSARLLMIEDWFDLAR